METATTAAAAVVGLLVGMPVLAVVRKQTVEIAVTRVGGGVLQLC
jgi:phosphohistidine swiveling domain-containing protein